MAKTVDFTAKASVPPPAKPVDVAAIISKLPTPVGTVQMTKMSPAEAKALAEMGVHRASEEIPLVLPENFSEISDAAKAAVLSQFSESQLNDQEAAIRDAERMSKGQQGLPFDEVDINLLPEEHRAAYQKIINSVIESTKSRQEADRVPEGMDPSVAAAIRAEKSATFGNNVGLKNDLQNPAYASGAPKPAFAPPAPPAPSAPPVIGGQMDEHSRVCARCGFPKNKTLDDLEISEDDKLTFFQSMVGLARFQKVFSIFGGRLMVTVRNLSTDELDWIFYQLAIDGRRGVTTTFPEEVEFSNRYRLVLQLVSVISDELNIVMPKSKDEWVRMFDPKEISEVGLLQLIWLRVKEQLGNNEHFYRMLSGLIGEFNRQCHKLEKLVHEPDFW